MLREVPLDELGGVKVAVAPEGRPVTLKLTAAERLAGATTLMESLPVWPCATMRVLAPALRLKT